LANCRKPVFEAQSVEFFARAVQERGGEDIDRLGALGAERRKGRDDIGRTVHVHSLELDAEHIRARSAIAWRRAGTVLAGSLRTAKRRAAGTMRFRISSFFATSSVARMLTPVVLPPGLAKLEMS